MDLRQQAKQHMAYLMTSVFVVTAVAALLTDAHATRQIQSQAIVIVPDVATEEEIVPGIKIHQSIPASVKGIYVSGWVAGTKLTMDHIFGILDTTQVNTVVIDIKDATGRLSYQPVDPELKALGVGTKRISDLPALIKKLHDKNMYVIGRVAVFQDPYYSSIRPAAAYKDTRTGETWHDGKGIAWLRADNEDVWKYAVAIGRDAYAQGFDEINLDYVRFPSDGAISSLDKSGMTESRPEIIRNFFAYMDKELRGVSHIPLSADIFGLTTSATGDLGIGQILEYIVPHVDYVAPMVYPSHYAAGSFGIANPASRPYDIVHRAMADGTQKLVKMGENPLKLRPWLQDFDLGAVYTADMVRAQMTATTDAGLDSWMLWDPRNVYTKGAL